ncbi:MAG: 4-hydroxy-2-oxovalerate aldolase [bacterium]|nr:4-hydroxy-2-oxovalerate aldolase [bacterium]
MTTIFDRTPEILDVTLRDGSYLIDFQFTARDTAKIAAALEAVGLRWIEVGHGLGLNASQSKGRAAATDEEYLEAAAASLKLARWGMFCIPGIARLEDLRLAASYRMPFVRVGVDVTTIELARPYIELAKELGLLVSFNAMKSYAVSPSEFGRCAALARSWGSDLVCLVDSAGGMFPEEIARYIEAARGECDAHLGFHGHDNLAMAMANTLSAIDRGAALVDSSLQGMGRSAGNTVTEALVAILKQRGHLDDVDLNGVMDVGQGLIAPLMHGHGLNPMAITAGYARFHSSFTSKVKRYAQEYDLDVRDMIVRLTQEEMVNAPDDLLDRIGRELAAQKIPRTISIPAYQVRDRGITEDIAGLRLLLDELRSKAVKAGKFSALNIVMADAPSTELKVSANIQATPAHMIGSVTLTAGEPLVRVLEAASGNVDVVFLDTDRKPDGVDTPGRLARDHFGDGLLLTYSDSRVWVGAVEDQIVRMLDECLEDRRIAIVGDHPKSRLLAMHLAGRLARVVLLGEAANPSIRAAIETFSFDPTGLDVVRLPIQAPEAISRLGEATLVIAWPVSPGDFNRDLVESLPTETPVLDAGIGSLHPDALAEAQRRGMTLLRVNMWPAMAGALEAAHESARVRQESQGRGEVDGIEVVAGGVIGRAGDVVVDSISNPTRVIGVADGGGGVEFNHAASKNERVRRVTEEINRRQVAAHL